MRALPRRDILIFDLDGTLVDTLASLADLFCDCSELDLASRRR
jgi:hypothetical protein